MSRGSLAGESGVVGRSTRREDGGYTVDRAHPQAAIFARRNAVRAARNQLTTLQEGDDRRPVGCRCDEW